MFLKVEFEPVNYLCMQPVLRRVTLPKPTRADEGYGNDTNYNYLYYYVIFQFHDPVSKFGHQLPASSDVCNSYQLGVKELWQ